MSEKYKGMEPLPGLPDINQEIEQQFPGTREIFDIFLAELRAPSNIQDEIRYDRDEFPIEAAIATPDDNGILRIISRATNHTRSHRGSLGHAEMIAIENTFNGDKHLPEGAVLLSTVEPCAMCASGLHRSGGNIVVFGASQDEIRGQTSWVNGKPKPFAAEPDGYTAKEFLLARNPSAVVLGGYRQSEVMRQIL